MPPLESRTNRKLHGSSLTDEFRPSCAGAPRMLRGDDPFGSGLTDMLLIHMGLAGRFGGQRPDRSFFFLTIPIGSSRFAES